MVSLQVQTFRNSLTQRKQVMAVSALRDAQGRAARLVQSLCHPQPVLSTPGTICCQTPSYLCQDGVGGVQPSSATFHAPGSRAEQSCSAHPATATAFSA